MSKIKVGPNISLPMPVTLVGSIIEQKANFMAAGWVTRVNSKPPYIGVGVNKVHYTPLGIQEKRTFSVNFPAIDIVTETDYCGLVSGRNADKSGIFEVFYGDLKTAPMIKNCPLSMECKMTQSVDLPTNSFFIAEIINIYPVIAAT